MEKLVAFLVMIVLIIVGIYFIHENKFNGQTFSLFTIALIILFIAFYYSARLKEFNVSGMKLVLSEMKDTKSNFDERVALLLDTLSELNIDHTINEGMMIDGPNPDKLIKAREISENMLSLAGKSAEQIAIQTDKIDARVLASYASVAVRNAQRNSETIKGLSTEEKSNVSKKLNDISRKFFLQKSTPKSENIDELLELFRSLNIEEELYKEYIADMRFFLREKTLKRPFNGYSD